MKPDNYSIYNQHKNMRRNFESKLLKISKVSLTKSEITEIIENIYSYNNSRKLTELLINNCLAPLFYYNFISKLDIDFTKYIDVSKIKSTYFAVLYRNTILYNHFRIVSEAFLAQEIKVIALKGIYLSESLYKNIALRQFSDIDLLIKEVDSIDCIDILKKLGYKPIDTHESEFVKSKLEIVHYSPMILDGVSIELHIKLHKNDESYNVNVDCLWENATPVLINGINTLTLNIYDQLIHLCIHLDKHIKTGHAQFTSFMDIVNFVQKFQKEINWIHLGEICQKYNTTKEVYKYLILCNKHLETYIPEQIVQKYGYCLDKKTEIYFYHYTNISTIKKIKDGQSVSIHIFNTSKIEKLNDKVHYIVDILFPSKEFLLCKYYYLSEIRIIKKFYWFLYPYRWFMGIKGLIKLIITNK